MFNAANHLSFRAVLQIAALIGLVALPASKAPAAGINPNLETVSIYLNVEKDSSLITGLRQGNFRLYEDGNAKPFRLEPVETPASIALLVEYSRSSGYYIDDINAAMGGLLKHAPEDNWYALATFSNKLAIDVDFTQQIGRLTQAYAALAYPGWTEINTYDAVYEMLDKMGRLQGRRILIVIGSGFDTFSEHNMDDVKKKAEQENVTIFAAGTGSTLRTTAEPYLSTSGRMNVVRAQAFLQMLAKKSGGFAWFPMQFNAFPDVVQGIMQSIGTQYRLVYDSTARGSGKFHKIKVEAFRIVDDKREDFKVLVREGWR